MKTLSIKIPHVVSVIVMAGVGAFISYFTQENPGTLIVALSHWSSAEPMLLSALAAAGATVLPLIQHSILVPVAPPSSGSAVAVDVAGLASLPKTGAVPPGRSERTSLFAFAFPVLALVAACTAAQLASLRSVADSSGAMCSIVVLATDPTLSPLCATPSILADAYEALDAAYLASKGDAGADAAGVGSAEFTPNQAALYAFVASHGGTPVGSVK
jgi:hypothetical protein